MGELTGYNIHNSNNTYCINCSSNLEYAGNNLLVNLPLIQLFMLKNSHKKYYCKNLVWKHRWAMLQEYKRKIKNQSTVDAINCSCCKSL